MSARASLINRTPGHDPTPKRILSCPLASGNSGRGEARLSADLRDRGQPRVCPRLASTHTEAGEAFIAYARRIIALNDEAALQLGAAKTTASVRLGLPQDFFDDVMPATLRRFGQDLDKVHVDVRAGENHSIAEEVRAGRLDAALAFFRPGSPAEGETLCALPMH